MKLPEKDYFTFLDLCDRFKCSAAYLHHLILTERLRPSLFLDDVYFRILWSEEEVDGDLNDIPRPHERVRISRLMYLDSIRKTGIERYEFRHFTMLCNADRLSSTYPVAWDSDHMVNQWFRFEQGDEPTEVNVEKNGVFIREVVEKFEKRHTNVSLEPIDRAPVNAEISSKSITAYLNIIGALCDMYWRAKFPTESKIVQARIIEVLTDQYRDFHGLSERNLKEQLPKAIKAVKNE